jgi:hypothetical protein
MDTGPRQACDLALAQTCIVGTRGTGLRSSGEEFQNTLKRLAGQDAVANISPIEEFHGVDSAATPPYRLSRPFIWGYALRLLASLHISVDPEHHLWPCRVGSRGQSLVYFVKGDATRLHTFESGKGKAVTAVAFRRATAELLDSIRGNPAFWASLQ